MVHHIHLPLCLVSLPPPVCLSPEHLNDEVKRRFYKNYFKSKKKAFTKYAKKYEGEGKAVEAELEALKAHATVIRVLAHTQIKKINNWGQKKSHLMEIQVPPTLEHECFSPPDWRAGLYPGLTRTCNLVPGAPELAAQLRIITIALRQIWDHSHVCLLKLVLK